MSIGVNGKSSLSIRGKCSYCEAVSTRTYHIFRREEYYIQPSRLSRSIPRLVEGRGEGRKNIKFLAVINHSSSQYLAKGEYSSLRKNEYKTDILQTEPAAIINFLYFGILNGHPSCSYPLNRFMVLLNYIHPSLGEKIY